MEDANDIVSPKLCFGDANDIVSSKLYVLDANDFVPSNYYLGGAKDIVSPKYVWRCQWYCFCEIMFGRCHWYCFFEIAWWNCLNFGMKTSGLFIGLQIFFFLLWFDDNDTFYFLELYVFVWYADIIDVARNLSIAVSFMEYNNFMHFMSTCRRENFFKIKYVRFIKIQEFV